MTGRTPEDIAEAINSIALLIGAMADNAAHIAYARRTLYQAYLAEGFTQEEALELCQNLLLT